MMVASGILPDVEGGIPAARRKRRNAHDSQSFQRLLAHEGFFPPGKDARLYGSQGWPPPLNSAHELIQTSMTGPPPSS
jgi:hypothetical protein